MSRARAAKSAARVMSTKLVAGIAATVRNGKVAAEMTDLTEEQLAKLLDPATLTRGGVPGRHG